MTLQQLRYIVAIDQHRHFGNAAEACNVTQSTMSLMVKKLEEELDVRIFDRDSYPLEPTSIGRKIIDKAKEVIYNAEQITELTKSQKSLLSGTLSVAMISTVAPILVPGLFKYFGTKCQSVSLMTEELLTESIKSQLHKAEIDMGILRSPVNDPDLLEIPLFSERFYVYASQDDPFYALDEIPAAKLSERPIWIMKKGVRLVDFSQISQDEDASYEKYFEGGRVSTLLQIVNDRGGATLIPELHVGLMLYSWHSGVRPIVDPEIRRTISLVVRRDYIHEAMLNVFIKAIKATIPAELLDSGIKKNYIRL